MKFGNLDHYYTGIAIPVSALRTEYSCGVGDFLDLEILADYCKQVGFEIIQILPINDTGHESSPYSALSAFALHPIYVRLQAVPEAADFLDEIENARVKFDNMPRLQYKEVLDFKLEILKKMFQRNSDAIIKGDDLKKWIVANPWVKPYAVFCLLKHQYAFCQWKAWPRMQNPTRVEIDSFWASHYDELAFYAWIQATLEKQLHWAAQSMSKKGIYLKGDIPILMNEDSVDVWMYREFFDLDSRAGAPPDMYSTTGQNWDFPIYKWDTMRKDGYGFWKSRLKQADKFYHAYRIDHVLGFFRIYNIPERNKTGRLGYFFPSKPITGEELIKAGFDNGRIRWLSEPHIPEWEVDESFEGDSSRIKIAYLNRIDNESLFNLKPEIDGEKKIESLDESEKTKSVLLKWYRDRALLEISPGKYQRVWTYGDASAFRSLLDGEKLLFEKLIKDSEKASEQIWEKHGTELLAMMQNTTDMLMCAEDLGVVPSCVPKVLKKLGILSLKIQRWTRKWEEPDIPYIPLAHYPLLSVCTPSVHDTNTILGWWDLELDETEKERFVRFLGYQWKLQDEYTPELAEYIFINILKTTSIICIFQIQELFALTTELRISNPEEERVNVPGTISGLNWTYRIYSSIEFLQNYEKLAQFLYLQIKKRKERQIDRKTIDAKTADKKSKEKEIKSL